MTAREFFGKVESMKSRLTEANLDKAVTFWLSSAEDYWANVAGMVHRQSCVTFLLMEPRIPMLICTLTGVCRLRLYGHRILLLS